jgi:hypothetical protein
VTRLRIKEIAICLIIIGICLSNITDTQGYVFIKNKISVDGDTGKIRMKKYNNKIVDNNWRDKIKLLFQKLVKIATFLLKSIFRYSGLEFIFRKFYPVKNSSELPTGLLWLFGIYITMFGIAFQRYESRTFKIDNLVNNVMSQIDTDRRSFVLSRIPNLQWQPCPLKPEIFNPKSVFISLFGDDSQYEEQVEYLKDILVDYRNSLKSLNLGYCDLRGVVFMGGNLEKSTLAYAKLHQAVFGNVSFKNTDFFNAKFKRAWFTNCDFSEANLLSVNFEDTFFHKCNLQDAKNIKIEQLLKCRSLYECALKPDWLEVIKKQRPELLKWPNGIDTNFLEKFMKRNLPDYMHKIFKEHTSD